jgi:ribonuclease HI
MTVHNKTLQTLEVPRVLVTSKLSRPLSKWKKNPDDTVKLNSDGAIQVDSGYAASGVVARDNVSFLAATCRSYQGLSDSLSVEAVALRDAVMLAVKRGYQKLIFETDCTELLKHWDNRAFDRSTIKPILVEIDELVNAFSSFCFVFARREANQAAHCCAKYASIQARSFSWDTEPPAFLVHSLEADCNPVLID